MFNNNHEITKDVDNTNNITAIQCKIENIHEHLPMDIPNLTIISQNIRSIHKTSNIDDLDINLSIIKNNIDIIALCECRINAHKPLPQKQGYTTYHSIRKVNQNDGVVLFINNQTVEHTVKEIPLTGASCLEVTTPQHYIICIYRPPSETNPNNFITALNNYLTSPYLKHKNLIITGDININIIEGHNNTYSDRYIDMLASHGLLPGHRFDTRNNSCLDHIITNLSPISYTGLISVLNTTITDHKMICLFLYTKSKQYTPSKTKIETDYSAALQSLKSHITDDLFLINNVDHLATDLNSIIRESLKQNTKVIKLPCSKRIIKPWITPGVLKCIKNRNNLQFKLRQDENNAILKITYRRYRNYCTNLLKKLKANYERELIDKAKSNNKTLWNCLKKLTNLNKQKTPNNELINLKNSPTESANFINYHFNGIGKSLAQKIQNNQSDLNEYVNTLPSSPHSIGIVEPDALEVNQVISGLKSDSAAGWDEIPTKFIKMAKSTLIPIITHLCSICFKNGLFPKVLKHSIIHPIFKNGSRQDINNYRPISVLPVIAKILEKLINVRLVKYLTNNNILSNNQYGFRQGLSTEDAIHELVKRVTKSIDSKKKALCIFLDLKKAFDTVSVKILLRKMEKIGIRGVFLDLMTSYMTGRSQQVKLNSDTLSDEIITSEYSVPQGSALGPTLFLIFINDLTNLKLHNGTIISYADDTALLFEDISWPTVFECAELGLHKVMDWLKINSLTLNTNKTNYIPFSINNSTQPSNSFNIIASL